MTIREYIESSQITFKDLHEELIRHGIKMTYEAFMRMVNGRPTKPKVAYVVEMVSDGLVTKEEVIFSGKSISKWNDELRRALSSKYVG